MEAGKEDQSEGVFHRLGGTFGIDQKQHSNTILTMLYFTPKTVQEAMEQLKKFGHNLLPFTDVSVVMNVPPDSNMYFGCGVCGSNITLYHQALRTSRSMSKQTTSETIHRYVLNVDDMLIPSAMFYCIKFRSLWNGIE